MTQEQTRKHRIQRKYTVNQKKRTKETKHLNWEER